MHLLQTTVTDIRNRHSSPKLLLLIAIIGGRSTDIEEASAREVDTHPVVLIVGWRPLATFSSDGLGFQVTKPARAAGLVEEIEDSDVIRLADVRVFAFNDVLLVVDIERVETEDIAELIASAIRDTKSMYRVIDSSVQIAGNGYQVISRPQKMLGSPSVILLRAILLRVYSPFRGWMGDD